MEGIVNKRVRRRRSGVWNRSGAAGGAAQVAVEGQAMATVITLICADQHKAVAAW